MEGRNSIQSFTFATMGQEETSTTGRSSLQEPPVVVAHTKPLARKDYVPKQETPMTRLKNLQFPNNAWVYGISNSNNVYQWYLKNPLINTAEQVNIFLFDSDLSILFIFFYNTDSKCTHFCVIKYIHSSQY